MVLNTTWNLYLCAIVRRFAYVVVYEVVVLYAPFLVGNTHVVVLRIPGTAPHYLGRHPFLIFIVPFFSVLSPCIVDSTGHAKLVYKCILYIYRRIVFVCSNIHTFIPTYNVYIKTVQRAKGSSQKEIAVEIKSVEHQSGTKSRYVTMLYSCRCCLL